MFPRKHVLKRDEVVGFSGVLNMHSLGKLISCALLTLAMVAPPVQCAEDIRSYLTSVATRARENYFPPQGTEMYKAVITFDVECDGAISNIFISKPVVRSGHRIKTSDDALKLAAKKSSPLPKPPASLHCPAKLSVTFDGKNLDKPFTAQVSVEGTKYVSDVVGYTGR